MERDVEKNTKSSMKYEEGVDETLEKIEKLETIEEIADILLNQKTPYDVLKSMESMGEDVSESMEIVITRIRRAIKRLKAMLRDDEKTAKNSTKYEEVVVDNLSELKYVHNALKTVESMGEDVSEVMEIVTTRMKNLEEKLQKAKTFTEQEIGRATVNIDIDDKDKAKRTMQPRTNEREQEDQER